MATHVNWHDTKIPLLRNGIRDAAAQQQNFNEMIDVLQKRALSFRPPQPSFNSISHPCHRVLLSNGHPEPGSNPLCPFTIQSSSNVSPNDDKAFFHCRLTTVSIHRNAVFEEWKIWSRNVKWRWRRREWNEEKKRRSTGVRLYESQDYKGTFKMSPI